METKAENRISISMGVYIITQLSVNCINHPSQYRENADRVKEVSSTEKKVTFFLNLN
jgi:hypothetical protein